MSEANKLFLRGVFAETAKGNGRPFVDALADDVRWTIIGHTAWSRTYEGKRAVLEELLRPLSEQLGGRNVVSAGRFVADGDVVVVEGRNHSVTASGRDYPNRYCWVFVMRDGEIAEITEYTDTQLIAEVLAPPAARPGPQAEGPSGQ
ncbi:nuclear transport factor 2 family protein [Nonomuraea rhodomycinica]|uniref:Nuclear transport factor 2 family protein n=1 Tax=Nonomuraea rhodomycinica TaxID=1712872 RepID=A0A7Y6IU48_9ACTN|nr:nuclear transport factor 2 family protein [Nonomuraea rhodomycinica]NUW44426.1 nuclear transport factor 2 family protein [Nonomuraea rhodomycinica]